MIPRSVDSILALGSVLTAQSLEPASDSVSSFISASPQLTFCLSLKNKHLKNLKKYIYIVHNWLVYSERLNPFPQKSLCIDPEAF